MIKDTLKKLSDGNSISRAEAKDVMNEIMDGSVDNILISSYLTALAVKGYTADEITGSAEAMREHSLHIDAGSDLLEIVGTGGDGSCSINISTTSAIVAAAGGVRVAKHGNRAASSSSGSADVLDALGVNISIEPEKSLEILNKIGICFMFAQYYHKAMKYAAPVRKELGFRTIFNVLGPLTNPASADIQLLGVYSEDLVDRMADALISLGVRRGMVVFGRNGMDELSVAGDNAVCEFAGSKKLCYILKPEDTGLGRYSPEELRGGNPEENAEATLRILNGKEIGAKRDAVLFNSGAALYLAGKSPSIASGVSLARDIIDSGKALEKLNDFIRESNS